MDDIDHEELVSALEEIVREFSDKIGPFARDLAIKLVQKYNDMVRSSQEEEEGFGESQIASTSCVAAIKRILMSVADNKPLIRELGNIIFPVLVNSLKEGFHDQIDETISFADQVIYGL